MEYMTKVMQDNGYYKSTITYRLQPHEDTRQMDVTFDVVPGEVARIGNVALQGDTGIPPEKVRKITKLKPAAPVRSAHLTRALERLRKNYQKNNHLEAQVALIDRQYHPDPNRLDYIFKVDEGPKVAILTEGQKVRRATLRKLVPVYQENAVDDDLLNEGRRNLRDYLQTQGYFDAEVDVDRREEPGKDLVNIVYKIDPGVRHKLAAIKVEGNKYFDTETIRERMSIQTSSLILEHGRFSQRLLTNDVAAIKYLYQSNGFQDVKVEPEIQENYGGQQDQLRVLIKIDEGQQTIIHSLTVSGNKKVSIEELMALLSSLQGQPYSETNVAADRDAVTYYYYNHGFPNLDFEAVAHQVSADPPRVDLAYTIQEGEQVFVDRVIVTGLNYTRPYVVDRRLRVHPGDPISQSEMVDSQRRLYDLGIFNQVDMAVQNPDGKEPEKDVLFNLREAQRWIFRYGGGIEFATGNIPGRDTPQGNTGISPNGVLEITRLNFLGRDQTFTFRGRLGLLTRRVLVSYDAPRLLRKENWRLTLTGFYDNTADVNTFTSERLEGSIQAEQKISRVTTMFYRLSYQRVRVDPNSLVIDPALIPLYSQPVVIGMPSVTYIRDKRDNAIDPHTGSYTAADMGLATTALGSQADFGRALMENSTYYTIKKRWVLARRTQIGIEYPYGVTGYGPATSNPLEANQNVIPLPVLFFAGGSNSLRGFAINQAGPRDEQTGYPIGGQGLFVNNVELRTPPLSLPYAGQNLGLVFFHDMGNVYDTANHIARGVFTLHQPSIAACSAPGSKTPCNFSYNPQAIGMGIRYKTPVGPVRVDFAYNLNPTRYPIQQDGTTETLRHINFFFSIGQTF
jgi:outer membrane protein assembly complex protein YaeT